MLINNHRDWQEVDFWLDTVEQTRAEIDRGDRSFELSEENYHKLMSTCYTVLAIFEDMKR